MLDLDIKIPYTMKPSFSIGGYPLINYPPDGYYLNGKIEELSKWKNLICGQTTLCDQLELVESACRFLDLPIQRNITDLGLLIEEDVALLHRGKLEAVCFCFPSSWTPISKLGKTLGEIHQDVADGTKLVGASNHLVKLLSESPNVITRQVWTITGNPGLSNLPDKHEIFETSSIDDLYIRVERQKSAAIVEKQLTVFTVKVEVYPLIEVWHDYGSRILESINSMSDNILKYKNLVCIKNILNSVK